jgi:hypothetical protein
MALDAKTAGRLRDERPVELELRGLSRAEFELIKAYLERNERSASCVATRQPRNLRIQPRSSGSRTSRPARPGKVRSVR